MVIKRVPEHRKLFSQFVLTVDCPADLAWARITLLNCSYSAKPKYRSITSLAGVGLITTSNLEKHGEQV